MIPVLANVVALLAPLASSFREQASRTLRRVWLRTSTRTTRSAKHAAFLGRVAQERVEASFALSFPDPGQARLAASGFLAAVVVVCLGTVSAGALALPRAFATDPAR